MTMALVADFEAGTVKPRETDIARVRAALERAGVEFIGDVGVKL
jgi:hypothetical protein